MKHIICMALMVIFATVHATESIDLKYFEDEVDVSKKSYVQYYGINNKLKRYKLHRGDMVVGLYGKQIISKMDYDFICVIDEEENFHQLDLQILRGGKVVNVKPLTDPFRKIDLLIHDGYPRLARWAQLKGLSLTSEAAYCLYYFPEKVGADIVEHCLKNNENPKWLEPLFEYHAKLRVNSWDEVDKPTIETTPIRSVNNLLLFYGRIIEWHKSNKPTIELTSDLGCDMAYFSFNAPVPIPYYKVKQELTGPSNGLNEMLDAVINHRMGYNQRPNLDEYQWLEELGEAYRKHDDEIYWYIQRVFYAMIAPESNGGWPYKYSSHSNKALHMRSPEGREEIYKRLKKLGEDDIVKLALIVPSALTKRVDEAERLVNDLIKKSQTWAPVIMELYNNAMRYYKYIPRKNSMDFKIELPTNESRLFEYLQARSVKSEIGDRALLIFPKYSNSFYHPANIYECIRKEQSIQEAKAKIKQGLNKNITLTEKKALAKMIVDYALPNPSDSDFDSLLELSNYGGARGIILSELHRMCYRMHQKSIYHDIIPNYQRLVYEKFMQPKEHGESSRYEKVSKALETINKENALSECNRLYKTEGDLAVAFKVAQFVVDNNLEQGYEGLSLNECAWFAFYPYIVDGYRPTYYKRATTYSLFMPFLNISKKKSIQASCANVYARQLKGADRAGLLNAAFGFYIGDKHKQSIECFVKATESRKQNIESLEQIHYFGNKATRDSDEFEKWLLNLYLGNSAYEPYHNQLKESMADSEKTLEEGSNEVDDF